MKSNYSIISSQLKTSNNFNSHSKRGVCFYHFFGVIFTSILCSFTSIAQDLKASNDSQSPFDAVKGKREDISKRDLYSKHYKNDDGSYTALIGAGPVHYEKNGQFYDINHNITSNGDAVYPYTNTTNLFESYFGQTSHTGIKSVTAEGEVKEFLNNKMYWEVNGQAVNIVEGANIPVNIQGNKAYYNLYGSISAEFIVKSGERKLNYIVPDKQSLGIIPSNADYLVFSEEIELPSGFNITNGLKQYNKIKKEYEAISGIFVTDSNGNVIYSYSAPSILEGYNSEVMGLPSRMNPEITFQQQGNVITLYTKVNASWIADDERTYPIAIDPTATVYPFTTNYSSGQTYSSGGGSGNIAAGYSGGWYRGWATFNLGSTSLSGVTAATMSLYIVNKGGTHGTGTTNINIGHTSFDLSRLVWLSNYTNLYNAIAATNNADGAYNYIPNVNAGTWTTVNLKPATNARALEEIERKSGNEMAFFPVSFSPSWGSGTTTRYYVIAGYTETNKPYLTVTYTEVDKYKHPAYQYANAGAIGDVGYIQIGNVSIGTINNTTAITNYAANAATIYRNTPTGYNKYNLSTNVDAGSSYTLNVTYRDLASPYNSGKIAVWVDWNDDGDFADTDEYIGLSANTTSGNQLRAFTINVPSGASAGIKRLRIRSFFHDDIVTSSSYDSLFEYGETEDYNVVVVAAPSMTCSTLSNLTASIGSPANGANHVLNLNWAALSGATSYDVQFSQDNGTSYQNVATGNVTANNASHHAGDIPDQPFLFRVRAKNSTQTCAWTNVGPIYTAADVPGLPVLSNAVGTSLDLTIPAETPVPNPAHTEYSITCQSTGQFVQANGTLGNVEVWQTKAQWGTVTVTGLTTGNMYCFYLKARNGDGHIVGGSVNQTVSWGPAGVEDFDAYNWYSYCGSSISSLDNWMPCLAGNGTTWAQTSSNGCNNGNAVQYTANISNASSLLRSPRFDATGLSSITVSFDMTNSYDASHTNDRIYFYIGTWGYSGGLFNTYTDPNSPANQSVYFDRIRNCERVQLTFDISAMNPLYKSNMTIGIWSNGTSVAHNFNVVIDNFSVGVPAPTSCITLALAPTPVFHDYGGGQHLSFNNSRLNTDKPYFRLSHGVGTVSDYEVEINTSHTFSPGTSWTQTFSGSYTANTQRNFQFINASSGLVDGTTYYVRARADIGAGYGPWTTKLYSFTYRASGTEMEWFQTTTPQFDTDQKVNIVSANHEVSQNLSGGSGNLIVNGSFATNTSGWTLTGISGSARVANLVTNPNSWGGGNWLQMGSATFGTGSGGTGSIVVAQQIDLTNISTITFNAGNYYNVGSPSDPAPNTKAEFKIGGTLSDVNGTIEATITQMGSGQGYSYHRQNKIVDVTNYTGVHVIKFVMTYNSSWNGNGSVLYFFDDIIANTTPSGITSPAIHKASVQGASGFTNLFWEQELNGGSLNLGLQSYNLATNTWNNISGYSNISDNTDGNKTFDISSVVADSLRIVATLSGTSAVKLKSWGLGIFTSTPLPVKMIKYGVDCGEDIPMVFWSTASEKNSKIFIVEYSTDMHEWKLLGEEAAAENSNSKVDYSMLSKRELTNQLIYYRIIQVDNDGKEFIYGPFSSDCKSTFNMDVYPNPNSGAFHIVLNSLIDTNCAIEIYDIQGKLISMKNLEINKGENIIPENIVVDRGVYFVIVKYQNETFTQRIVVNY